MIMITSLVHGAKETTMIKDLKKKVASEMIVRIETGIVIAIEEEAKIGMGTEAAVLDPVAIMAIPIGIADKTETRNVSIQLSREMIRYTKDVVFLIYLYLNLIIII